MNIKIANWPFWFQQMWPTKARRDRVLEGYSALGAQHPDLLADIALRNNVFAAINEPDAHAAAIAEGRRQAALEIVKLCNMNPADLVARIERGGSA